MKTFMVDLTDDEILYIYSNIYILKLKTTNPNMITIYDSILHKLNPCVSDDVKRSLRLMANCNYGLSTKE